MVRVSRYYESLATWEPSKLVVFVTNDLISVPSAAAAAEESAMVENPAARGAAVTGYALLQHSAAINNTKPIPKVRARCEGNPSFESCVEGN